MWSKAHRCFVEEGSVFGGPDGCVCVCLCVSVNVLMRPGGMHALADVCVCVCVCAIKKPFDLQLQVFSALGPS